MEEGNVREFIKKLRDEGNFFGREFLDGVNRWVRADFYREKQHRAHFLARSYIRLPAVSTICTREASSMEIYAGLAGIQL